VVVYVLADLDAIMIPPVLLAVATVADRRGWRTPAAAALLAAWVVAAMPFLHGDRVSLLAGTLPQLAAVALAAGAGAWVRTHRHPVIPARGGPGWGNGAFLNPGQGSVRAAVVARSCATWRDYRLESGI